MDPSGKGKKRKSYTLEFKLKVVNELKEHSGESLARKYSIHPRRIREWKHQKEKLKNTIEMERKKVDDSMAVASASATASTAAESVSQSFVVSVKKKCKRRRLMGPGKTTKYPLVEAELAEWITTQRSEGRPVSVKSGIAHARQIYDKISTKENDTFPGSRHWWYNFTSRYGFSMRIRTSVGQKLPENLKKQLVSYILKISQARSVSQFQASQIYAADETAVWFDMPANRTIHAKGDDSVKIITTGHEKSRVTVMLCASGDGTKTKPAVIFKGKGTRTNINVPGVNVLWSDSGWMTEDCAINWVRRSFGRFDPAQKLLSWDTYATHMSAPVCSELSHCRVTPVYIPAGCTGLIQAPDVAWNKPFKDRMKELYEAHMSREPVSSKVPSKEMMCRWVKDAWQNLPQSIIEQSFKSCALTTAIDGTEDQEIHCLKKFNEAKDLLTQLRVKQLGENSAMDPFLIADSHSNSDSDPESDADSDIEVE